jgi:heme-degrading monooxygenase HmoA
VFARVSRYHGETARLLEGFRRTIEPLAEIDGFARAYFLTDRTEDRAMTITLWESDRAMTASAEWASKAREHAAHDSGATIESVESYEVSLTAENPALR